MGNDKFLKFIIGLFIVYLAFIWVVLGTHGFLIMLVGCLFCFLVLILGISIAWLISKFI